MAEPFKPIRVLTARVIAIASDGSVLDYVLSSESVRGVEITHDVEYEEIRAVLRRAPVARFETHTLTLIAENLHGTVTMPSGTATQIADAAIEGRS